MRYLVHSTKPTFLQLLDDLRTMPPQLGQVPRIGWALVSLTDGTKVHCEGRKAQGDFDDRRPELEAKGVVYAKVRLFCDMAPEHGHLSITQELKTQSLTLYFKEYEFKHANEYKRACLSVARSLGLRCFNRQYQATARPVQALVLSIDLRGFTAFCSNPDVGAQYVAQYVEAFQDVATNALVDTTPQMSKPTGDGYLYVWAGDRVDLPTIAALVLHRVPELQRELRERGRREPFHISVPTELGAGMARGSAYAIGDDFVGRPLNLACRLGDRARPNGLVVDSSVFRDFPSSEPGWTREEHELKGFPEVHFAWRKPI